jgi:hypothetical protein
MLRAYSECVETQQIWPCFCRDLRARGKDERLTLDLLEL